MSVAIRAVSPIFGTFDLECDVAGRHLLSFIIRVAEVHEFDYYDTELLNNFIDGLLSNAPEIQAVYFLKHPADAPLHSRTLSENTFIYSPDPPCVCHYTDISEFVPKTGKSAGNIRRAEKAITTQAGNGFQIECGYIPSERIREDYLPAFAAIVGNSWKSHIQGKAAGLKSEENKVKLLNQKGELFYALLGDSPVSFFRGSLRDGVLRAEKLGYDDAYEKHSPGRVLITKIIDWAKNNPGVIEAIDWGWGDYPYKRHFATTSTMMQNTLVFRRTPRNRTIVLTHKTATSAVNLLKKLRGLKLRSPRKTVESPQ